MKNILVIRLSAMGDVAMTVPVISALVQQNTNVKVTVVSRPFFKPFFEGIERVHFFGVDLEKRHKGILGIYKLYQDLKLLNVDFVADLHNVLRSKILRSFFKIAGKNVAFVDKGRSEKKALTQANNKVFKPLKPMVKRHVDVFNVLGFIVDMEQIKFADKAVLNANILQIVGEKEAYNWIGIAPFAQYQTKVYPLNLMAETINLLAANTSNKILLFGGGADEIKELEKLKQKNTNVIVVAGTLKFYEELALIRHLDLMISMDSGNAHIAAMYGVKVVTLWGHTHPYAGFAPFNQPMDNCITANRLKYPLIPTSVYGNKMIEGYENVMETIAPEHIIEKVNELI